MVHQPVRNIIEPFCFGTGRFYKESKLEFVATTSQVQKRQANHSNDSNNSPNKRMAITSNVDRQQREEHIEQEKPTVKPEALYFRNSNLNPDGSVKTYLQRKQEQDMVIWNSRPPIEPSIPVDVLDKLFDLITNGRYHILEERDPQLAMRRQRTEWWYKNRENKITGSKLVQAAGIFGFEGMLRCYFETYDPTNPKLQEMIDSEPKELREKSAACMKFGTYNEIHAHATVVKHLGELWDIDVFETPLSPINPAPHFIQSVKEALFNLFGHEWDENGDLEKWVHSFADSPDGMGRFRKTGIWFSIEHKTPLGLRNPLPYEKMKWYYVGQCFNHNMTLSVKTQQAGTFTLFTSWSPTTTKMWKMKNDPLFWKIAMPLFMRFRKMGYDKTPPTELPDPKLSNFLAYYMKNASQRLSEYIGEFPSVYSTHWEEDVKDKRLAYWQQQGSPLLQYPE